MASRRRSRASRQTNGVQPQRTRDVHGVKNVARISGGADADKHIAILSIGIHLLGIGNIGSRVVSDRREQRGLADQGDRRQPALQMVRKILAFLRIHLYQFRAHFFWHRTFQQITLHQLTDDVLCICGAAAIATSQ